jgi:hypothetical protein
MRNAPPASVPPPAAGIEFDPVIRRERDRCLVAIRQSEEGAQRIARYADALDDFIRWSLAHEDLEHAPQDPTSSAGALKFVLRGTNQVVWEVSADATEGAKLIALPKTTSELPETIRAEVRQRWGGIDRSQLTATGRLRLWMRFLLLEKARHDAQAAIAWALENRSSRSVAAKA